MDTQSEKIIAIINQIPEGKVISYGMVADYAGLPGRARLVGRVLKQAPDHLSLPWQRVLRAGGHLAFAMGSTQFDKQVELLGNEGVEIVKGKVDIDRFGWKPQLAELLFSFRF
ncbi:MAG: MGMT family protein [Kangiellaceae bacterium]|jgi:methylated-DNA-protein-cysteine methyltransferase-like protein|nr:MGMT family protein [Kangiellaceae bacterium]